MNIWIEIVVILGTLGFFEATGHGYERDYNNEFTRIFRNSGFHVLKIEALDGEFYASLSAQGACSLAVIDTALLGVGALKEWIERATGQHVESVAAAREIEVERIVEVAKKVLSQLKPCRRIYDIETGPPVEYTEDGLPFQPIATDIEKITGMGFCATVKEGLFVPSKTAFPVAYMKAA